MILKKRTVPLILKQYDALYQRLPPQHEKKMEVEREWKSCIKGYQGEQNVDYYLHLLKTDYAILHDVTLEVNDDYFQMDNVLLSEKAIYIVEVKNYSGKLIFDSVLQQFTREGNGQITGYASPITQVEIQKQRLQEWLMKRGITGLPIHTFIAISDPATRIEVKGDSAIFNKQVVRGENIAFTIRERDGQTSPTNLLDTSKISREILLSVREFHKNLLKRHDILPTDLYIGITCKHCGKAPLQRKHSKWVCTACQSETRDAHQKAMEEYLLLIRPWFTNASLRQWLHIPSRQTATRMLKASPLVYDQKRKIWKN